MRAWLVATLMLSVLVPASGAQETGAHFMEDAEGDTELETFGLPLPAVPASGADSADLLSMDVHEDDEAITFVVGVVAMSADATQAVDYQIQWTWHDVRFDVFCVRDGLFGGVNRQCRLASFHEDEGSGEGAYIAPEWDVAAATLTVRVEKFLILDAEGRAATRGDVLDDMLVATRQRMTSFGFFAQIADTMPDADTGRLPLVVGDAQQGHVRLTTLDRVRVSNGEATTFVFQANLTNAGPVEDTIKIAVADLPKGWNISHQSSVRVAGNASTPLALLVSVPFGHDHGGYSAFNVTATSQRDPGSFATMRMGVLHTPIPQPTGHHSKLWLHAQPQGDALGSQTKAGMPTMNANEAHDEDAPEAYATTGIGDGVAWEIPLDPGFGLGIDVDLESLGSLVGKVFGRSTGEGTVSAELWLVPEVEDDFSSQPQHDFSEGVLVAESDTAAVTLDTTAATDFALTLTPMAEADYVAYAPKRNLVLVVELRSEGLQSVCCFPGTVPTLDTKSFLLDLPLEEYHDKLTGVAEATAALDLRAEGEVEKVGRPGTVMTYVFTLVNPGGEDVVMDIDVAGNHADAGQVVPSGLVTIPARGEQKVTLAVAVPGASTEGEIIEVLVFAYARDDPGKMVIGRTKTTVALGAEALPDERQVLDAAVAEEAAKNESPGFGVAALVVAGAVAVALYRRR